MANTVTWNFGKKLFIEQSILIVFAGTIITVGEVPILIFLHSGNLQLQRETKLC